MMDLGLIKVGNGHKKVMFAEEGQANQGDFKFALKMIDLIGEAGADGIEFQIGIAEDLYISSDEGYDIYKKREFEEGQIKDLIDYTHSKNLVFQVAPLSTRIISSLVNYGSDVFTINAMDVNNPFMLDAVAESEKPFWLATLMSTVDEIDWAVDYLLQKGAREFGILHGQHVMATDHGVGVPPEYSQLDCIQLFKKKYNMPVGYVDHTPTVLMPALAVAKGADIVFKHISPSADWAGPDYGVCLSPEKWKESKAYFDYACNIHGSSKDLTQDEIEDRSHQRRSLYFAVDKLAGEKIDINDLVALRPGGCCDPKKLKEIVGKKVSKEIKAFTPVDLSFIK